MPQEALGQSESFLDFQEKLSRVAPVNRPVLLMGERGTGKELAASRLHYLSTRWDGPFVTLNCSTLTPTLIESELFGYQKGAFTGAESSRKGRFEAADGGTLFLDEIGTIPMVAQEKILRVVEYGSFERVGSATSTEVDVRIICATNADLAAMAEKGEFKRDLLDRLSFEVLFLPPLRNRTEDIMLLANHFGARMAFELDRQAAPEFSSKARHAMMRHPWPGNIRELKNVVERAVYKCSDDLITDIEFDPFVSPFAETVDNSFPPAFPQNPQPPPQSHISPLKDAVKKLEIHLLTEALEKTFYNQRKAAKMLQLTYDQFRGLLRKYKKELPLE